MKKSFLVLATFAFLVSCTSHSNKGNASEADSSAVVQESATTEVAAVPDGSNAQNSLDYQGTYKGVLPTASGEGMEVTIVLGEDNNYTKEYSYVGKKIEPTKSKGKYTWNTEGSTITLEGQDKPNQYFVGENTLTQLDTEGKKITGDIGSQYILKRAIKLN